MKRVATLILLIALYIFPNTQAKQEASLTALSLSTEEIRQISELAGLDLLNSEFVKNGDRESKKVIAISDFYNLADFPIDSILLARIFLQTLQDSKVFMLTNAIGGNASNIDPMLDSIRSLRNNKEFSDIIPKNALIAPQYSLSGRISSELKELGTKTLVQYTIILNITNLKNGLIEWNYVDLMKKVYEGKIPNNLSTQTRYGLICNGRIKTDMTIKEACELAIAEIWEGSFRDIPKNAMSHIARYAKKACELDSAFGCRAVGASYRYGVGEKQDFTKAMEFYKKACQNQDGNACYNVALLYQNAQGVKQDFNMASSYAHQSCHTNFEAGCELFKRLEMLVQQDELDERGHELERRCEQKVGLSCGNLAFYYYHGINGASRNPIKAAFLFQKGCDLNDVNSCYQLGLWYVQGLGGMLKDSKIAADLMEKACEGIKIKQNCDKTLPIDKCEVNFDFLRSNACFSLGGIYEHGGVHLDKDTQKALKFYKKSCDLNLKNSCVAYDNLKESLK